MAALLKRELSLGRLIHKGERWKLDMLVRYS